MVSCYYDDDAFTIRQEHFYLSNGFICPNFICPSKRDLSWPFLCACPAKKAQITSSDFLALKVPVSSEAEAGREESHRDVC